MFLIARSFLVVCLLGLVGCDRDDLVEKFTPHPEAEIARKAIDDWRTGHVDRIKPELAPEIAGIADKLGVDAAQLPATEPRSVKIVGVHSTFRGGDSRYDFTFEYEFEHRWLIAQVVLLKRGGRTEIAGMHAQPADRSIEQINAFALGDKGSKHFLMLFLAVASVIVSLTAFVLCLRTRMRRRKVWWAIFTLLGVTTVHIDWTTGAMNFSPVSIQLFGASMMSSGYGPWVLGVSFPLGAVWFLARRKKLTAPREEIH